MTGAMTRTKKRVTAMLMAQAARTRTRMRLQMLLLPMLRLRRLVATLLSLLSLLQAKSRPGRSRPTLRLLQAVALRAPPLRLHQQRPRRVALQLQLLWRRLLPLLMLPQAPQPRQMLLLPLLMLLPLRLRLPLLRFLVPALLQVTLPFD